MDFITWRSIIETHTFNGIFPTIILLATSTVDVQDLQ